MEVAQERPLVGMKEISLYLQKNERTVRRYRKLKAFPIYRVPGTASIYAFPAELNAWIRSL